MHVRYGSTAAVAAFALQSCVGIGLLLSAGGCGDDDAASVGDAGPGDAAAATDAMTDAMTDGGAPGALIRVTFQSKVGVLLDEIPSEIRERVATAMLAEDDDFWLERAKRQLALASYRLNFRAGFYDESDNKKQLPLPPPELFDIALTKAERAEVDGHDYVLCDYSLETMVLTDAASPAISEPALAEIGGSWDEEFIFPVDPELLLQRTGYACMDEYEFPPNSVDTEDVEVFYDQTCEVEPTISPDGCHATKLAVQSCVDALDTHVGKVEREMHFERIAWDAKKADAARLGPVSNPNGSDLEVLHEELLINRLTYRYVGADSCAIAENCVGGSGFRRLLQFNASEKNTGTRALEIGDVDYYLDDPDNLTANANHHIYEFSPCHMHYHFSHYATFSYGGDAGLGSKRAFCLESVQRYSNNEHSPTWSEYDTCHFQGITPGWGDQYNAGIECQWIDVTTIDTGAGAVTQPLGLVSNPDGFLCEGDPVTDKSGQTVWEPTDFKTAEGETVDRPKCDFKDDWDDNNATTLDVTLPPAGEGLITSECTHGQIGKLRNCGFAYDAQIRKCQAGEKLTLHCSAEKGSAPQVVRVCEASAVLGAGLACVEADALANTEIIGSSKVAVAFACPKARDDDEPGGLYALYTAPTFPGDPSASITCTP